MFRLIRTQSIKEMDKQPRITLSGTKGASTEMVPLLANYELIVDNTYSSQTLARRMPIVLQSARA